MKTSEEVKLNIDQTLLSTAIQGTIHGLQMTGVEPIPVGASRISRARHGLSVIVGLVGKNSGSMQLNLSEPAMLYLAGQLIDEVQTEVDEENIDAIMEVGNMVGGSIKEFLLDTEYGIDQISLPSMIAGQSYSVMYARGILTASVEFEIAEMPVTSFSDRYFSTTISLLEGSGQ